MRKFPMLLAAGFCFVGTREAGVEVRISSSNPKDRLDGQSVAVLPA